MEFFLLCSCICCTHALPTLLLPPIRRTRRQRWNARQRQRLVRRVSSFSVLIVVFFFICLTHTSLPISQTTVSRGVSIRRDSAEEVEWPARAAASAAGEVCFHCLLFICATHALPVPAVLARIVTEAGQPGELGDGGWRNRGNPPDATDPQGKDP